MIGSNKNLPQKIQSQQPPPPRQYLVEVLRKVTSRICWTLTSMVQHQLQCRHSHQQDHRA
jgi:hypothetical protein